EVVARRHQQPIHIPLCEGEGTKLAAAALSPRIPGADLAKFSELPLRRCVLADERRVPFNYPQSILRGPLSDGDPETFEGCNLGKEPRVPHRATTHHDAVASGLFSHSAVVVEGKDVAIADDRNVRGECPPNTRDDLKRGLAGEPLSSRAAVNGD